MKHILLSICLSVLLLTCSRQTVKTETIVTNDVYLPTEIGMTYVDYKKIEVDKIKFFIKEEVKLERNHILLQDNYKLTETATIISDVARQTNLDWEIIFTIISFESKFKYTAKAKDRPTIGLMQMHGRAWSFCSEVLERKVYFNDPEDQVLCGSIWLQNAIDECNGKLDHGIAKYATGYMCDYSKSISVKFIVNRRLNLINKLKKDQSKLLL